MTEIAEIRHSHNAILVGKQAHAIEVRNVNDAYRLGIALAHVYGVQSETRNGDVLRVPGLVTTVYEKPYERVLFDAQRNANPFFHLFEALWMLNGQNDVETMDYFLKTFKQFSDDGETYHGAYGYRWRHHFHFDQLTRIISMLRRDVNTRRAVIAMWDPGSDLGRNGRDIPCNLDIDVEIVGGALNIIVFNRSNDIIWGCYGANAVHMSLLQEYLASAVGARIGSYSQVSANYHAYLNGPYQFRESFFPLQLNDLDYANPYTDDAGKIAWFPLVTHMEAFDSELAYVMNQVRAAACGDHIKIRPDLENAFFTKIVSPMLHAWSAYKSRWYEEALDIIRDANAKLNHDNDWLMAAEAWITRAVLRRTEKV